MYVDGLGVGGIEDSGVGVKSPFSTEKPNFPLPSPDPTRLQHQLLVSVDKDEVLDLLRSLLAHKACGSDSVPYEALKMC